MEQIIVGIIVTVAGLALVVFKDRFVNSIVKLNNKGLGFYHYGNKEKRIGLWFTSAFGVLLATMGVLILFGIFELKQQSKAKILVTENFIIGAIVTTGIALFFQGKICSQFDIISE